VEGEIKQTITLHRLHWRAEEGDKMKVQVLRFAQDDNERQFPRVARDDK